MRRRRFLAGTAATGALLATGAPPSSPAPLPTVAPPSEWAEVRQANRDFVSSNGTPILVGEHFILFPDGTTFA